MKKKGVSGLGLFITLIILTILLAVVVSFSPKIVLVLGQIKGIVTGTMPGDDGSTSIISTEISDLGCDGLIEHYLSKENLYTNERFTSFESFLKRECKISLLNNEQKYWIVRDYLVKEDLTVQQYEFIKTKFNEFSFSGDTKLFLEGLLYRSYDLVYQEKIKQNVKDPLYYNRGIDSFNAIPESSKFYVEKIFYLAEAKIRYFYNERYQKYFVKNFNVYQFKLKELNVLKEVNNTLNQFLKSNNLKLIKNNIDLANVYIEFIEQVTKLDKDYIVLASNAKDEGNYLEAIKILNVADNELGSVNEENKPDKAQIIYTKGLVYQTQGENLDGQKKIDAYVKASDEYLKVDMGYEKTVSWFDSQEGLKKVWPAKVYEEAKKEFEKAKIFMQNFKQPSLENRNFDFLDFVRKSLEKSFTILSHSYNEDLDPDLKKAFDSLKNDILIEADKLSCNDLMENIDKLRYYPRYDGKDFLDVVQLDICEKSWDNLYNSCYWAGDKCLPISDTVPLGSYDFSSSGLQWYSKSYLDALNLYEKSLRSYDSYKGDRETMIKNGVQKLIKSDLILARNILTVYINSNEEKFNILLSKINNLGEELLSCKDYVHLKVSNTILGDLRYIHTLEYACNSRVYDNLDTKCKYVPYYWGLSSDCVPDNG